MLSVDFNEVSAIYARGSQIERVYAGSDLVWTESAPLKLVVELSTGQQFPFDLSALDQEYKNLYPFYMTWSGGRIFADPFAAVFGRQISSVAIEKVHDNQSTDQYGVDELAEMCLPYVKEIVFPKTTMVWSNCFKGCSRLERVVLPNLKHIGEDAFIGCYRLSSASFPNLEDFQSGAFKACSSLTSLEFGRVSAVPDQAFYSSQNSSHLVDISLPQVLSIDSLAFNENRFLQRVHAPNLQVIRDSAFTNCIRLSSISLTNVQSIGRDALNNTAVTSMIAPMCTNVDYHGCAYSSIGILYANQLQTIGPYAFYGCPISSINVDNLEQIDTCALSGNRFSSISFYKLKSIGRFGVAGDYLKSICIFNTLEDGVPSIKDNGDGKSIEDRCIIYVKDLEMYQQLCQSEGLSATQDRIVLLDCKDKTLAYSVNSSAFSEIKQIRITSDKLGSAVAATSDGEHLLEPFSSWRDYSTGFVWQNRIQDFYSISDETANVATISAGGFYKFENLSSASFPYCTKIEDGAFAECSSLVKLDIPSVETIGEETLLKTNLQVIDYPHLTAAGTRAFGLMPSLREVKLDSLLAAPTPLFTDATGLTSISMRSLSSIGSILGTNLVNVVELSLPSISGFTMPIAGPSARPQQLSALNLASISYSDFTNEMSVYVAKGFASTGCSLTCSDGVFVVT